MARYPVPGNRQTLLQPQRSVTITAFARVTLPPVVVEGKPTVDPVVAALGSRMYARAPVTSGQTVAVGLVTETDAAFAVAWNPKNRLIGQTSEADLAQPVARLKTKALGLNSETDLAQALTRVKTKALGLNTETDLAQTLTRLKTLLLGQTAETDLAQPVTSAATAPPKPVIYQARAQQPEGERRPVATQQLYGLLKRLYLDLGQPSETDTAQALTRVKTKAIGIVTETDLAQPVAWNPKNRLVQQVSESDLAQAVAGGLTVPTAPPKTVKAVTPFSYVRRDGVSRTSYALPRVGDYAPPAWDGVSPNTAIRQGSSVSRVPIIGQVPLVEPQEAFDNSSQWVASLSLPAVFAQPLEIDETLAIQPRKTKALGIATETDSVFTLTRLKTLATSTTQALEVDAALSVTARGVLLRTILQAVETDVALAVSGGVAAPHTVAVGQVFELEEALPVGGGVVVAEPVRARSFGRYSIRNQRR